MNKVLSNPLRIIIYQIKQLFNIYRMIYTDKNNEKHKQTVENKLYLSRLHKLTTKVTVNFQHITANSEG